MYTKELDVLWKKIKNEAQLLSNYEPILSLFLYNTLLQHNKLEHALIYILANKLGNNIVSTSSINTILQEIYDDDLKIIHDAAKDINANYQKDPAIDKYSTPLLYLKGFHALQAYRVSHWLWNKNRKALAVYLQNQISIIFGVDIHPAAHIGHGIILDHATGIVIGETSVIENNVSILQSVTLGGTGKSFGNRHPKIRDGVMIGAGAIILGNIEIGYGAKIGAGSVVLHSVPSYTTVTGTAARTVKK